MKLQGYKWVPLPNRGPSWNSTSSWANSTILFPLIFYFPKFKTQALMFKSQFIMLMKQLWLFNHLTLYAVILALQMTPPLIWQCCHPTALTTCPCLKPHPVKAAHPLIPRFVLKQFHGPSLMKENVTRPHFVFAIWCTSWTLHECVDESGQRHSPVEEVPARVPVGFLRYIKKFMLYVPFEMNQSETLLSL